MSTLHLVRGLPGSGKSTHVSKLLNQVDYPRTHEWFETDMFFQTNQGYEWSARRLFFAHSWCYYNTLQALYSGKDCFVSNTFTTLKEMGRYLELVDIIPDLKIHVVEMRTQYQSTHNVPQNTIDRMKARWYTMDPLPPQVSYLKVIK